MNDEMQTFLPYPSYVKSVKALDNRRLGKQRVEAAQIIGCLRGTSSVGWRRHPAVRMWRGHEFALATYAAAACTEWTARGFRDSLLPDLREIQYELLLNHEGSRDDPWWLGSEAFHASHRSNLLRKDPVYYGRFGWHEPHDLPYVWPAPGRENEHESERRRG